MNSDRRRIAPHGSARPARKEAPADALRTEVEARAEAENQIRRISAFRQAIIDRAAEGLCVCHATDTDPGTHFSVWNERMTEITGYTMEEINRIGWHTAMYPDETLRERATARMQRMRDGDDLRAEEWELTRKDGTLRTVAISTRVLDDTGHVLALMHDVTRMRHAEARLAAQRAKAVRSDRLRSLGEMAAGIAHELNQPLSGIRALAEQNLIALRQGWRIDPGELEQELGLLIEQVDRMNHIINHVRVFSREAGKPAVEPVDVNDVVRGCLRLAAEQLRRHDIEVSTELTQGLPLIRANPYSIEEVLLNLLSNARHAVESLERRDGGRIGFRTCCLGADQAVWVCIEISDNGPGIPAELQERVFEPFFTTKGPEQGTGIGLCICRSIVADSDGTIELESEVGRGTLVRLRFPALAGAAPARNG